MAPRLCGTAPADFFLWGYLKSKAHYDNSRTVNQHKENIRPAISEMGPNTCENVAKKLDETNDWHEESQKSPAYCCRN